MARFKNKDKKRKPLKRKIIFRKKYCAFCTDKIKEIDYKDVSRLSRFISERGKITPRRISGLCPKHQRKSARAIKRARYIALMSFIRK